MTTLEIDGWRPGSLRQSSSRKTELVVTLADGRKIATPLEWYPRLKAPRKAAREFRDHADGHPLAGPRRGPEHRRHAEGASKLERGAGQRVPCALVGEGPRGGDCRSPEIGSSPAPNPSPQGARESGRRLRQVSAAIDPGKDNKPLTAKSLGGFGREKLNNSTRRRQPWPAAQHRLDRHWGAWASRWRRSSQGRQLRERLEPHARQGRAAGQTGRARSSRRPAALAGLRCRVPDGLHRQGCRPGVLRQGRRRVRRQGQGCPGFRGLLVDLGRGIRRLPRAPCRAGRRPHRGAGQRQRQGGEGRQALRRRLRPEGGVRHGEALHPRFAPAASPSSARASCRASARSPTTSCSAW